MQKLDKKNSQKKEKAGSDPTSARTSSAKATQTIFQLAT